MKTPCLLPVVVAGLLAVTGCETTPPPQPRPPMHLPTPADITTMSKAGIADEVIISQIRNARVVYRLNSQQIIELNNAGVSQKVIDFMINTPRLYSR